MPILVQKHVRVLLTAGGTGGHIYPVLGVHDYLKRVGDGEIDISFAGQIKGFEADFEDRYIKVYPILPSKMRRYLDVGNIIDVPTFIISIFQALVWLYVAMPDVVFSKGGPGTVPVVFAAWFYRIPVLIHESDAVPGVTNVISARFARRIGVSFQSALSAFSSSKVFISGNPLRSNLMEDLVDQVSAKHYFGFRPEEPLLLILGGSQGSLRINTFILDSLGELLPRAQVLHQVGRAHVASIQEVLQITLRSLSEEVRGKYLLKDYLSSKDMKIALNAADVVIARSGAGTIFELAAFGKPAILIPLKESANDHQRANAYEYAATGAALILEEENLKVHILLSEVEKMLHKQTAISMAAVAEGFAKPKAAEIVGKEILKLVGVSV
ncbi:hypothetical protein A3A21_03590 [Candidatus Jorgensenbacteria bacterium RIFCSPLOWO2_01_FULL_45_25b]|uniref:UDP-N-acetylglucosamine--N-acetylmuramyl-(pentapeptide) pyrophosphoryl-undecaprenol N-acetylglucosamine transferase n=1 Tax=Candidatus Jorgensenbacteria bacterium RIFCSPLOWO2_01_FULL_45_25b TaxID=1798471 RepID=A0A1F6BY17_9BACT|nr:MAG: hypothetical protein A3A21_03590 [Candidatus Jorgensenbacteria bacterium RIFCSPLOWO2_01_FULL_45_25b]